MSDSLQPHGLQHTRLPCPSLSISWSLLKLMFIEFVMFSSISSSATPFSFCLQSFPASGSFPVSRLFASGGQSIGTSASVLPMNIQSWFPLELTGLISIQFKGLSRVFSSTIVWKHRFFGSQIFLIQLSHLYMTVSRSRHLLISWFQSPSSVILEPKKIKSVTISCSICHEVMGLGAIILVLECWILSQLFSLSSFTLIKKLLSSFSLSAIRILSSAYARLFIFLSAVLIPTCDSSSLEFYMMYSAYKLNKQSEDLQPFHTPSPILNQSVVPCPVLTVVSWPGFKASWEAGKVV